METSTHTAAEPAEARPATGKPGTPDRPASARPPTAPRPSTARPPTARPATAAAAATQRAQSAKPQEARPATAAAAAAAAAPGTPDRLLSCRPKTAGAGAPVTTGHLSDKTPMVLSYNPDPRLRSWQRLEHARLHQLGLSSKLSRRYNVARSLDFQPVGQRLPEAPRPGVWLPAVPGGDQQLQQLQQLSFYADLARKKNEVAPFRTFQKPICGAFFTRETDHKKIKHGLESADLIKWRYFL